jgi:peptide/nickel transport system substrate-binding protein
MRNKLVLPAVLAAIGALLLAASAFAGVAGTTSSTSKAGTVAKRGGTLKVDLSSTDFPFSDEGFAYDTLSWSMLYTTNLMLVNYPEKNGPQSGQIYPEGITAFPLVSKDGKTYTFTLRPGLKFSDGTPVTAAAYQRAFERNLSPKMGSPVGVNDYLDKILVGGSAFLAGKAQRISGITANGLKLVVHITKPNPTFVSILAMQWFGAVEPNTAYTTQGLLTMPSAGPYYIKSRNLGKSLVEVRNPYYKGSRPANADSIVFTANTDQNQTQLQVQAGQVDMDASQPPPTAYASLGQQYGVNKTQFHVGPSSCVYYLAMNTSRAPFNNVAARKAFEWGVDRPALVRLLGKYSGARTDQILVPGIPGYKAFKIYAIKGADPAKAKQVGGAAIKGNVTVVHTASQTGVARAQLLEYQLKQMGFGTVDKLVPGSIYFSALGTRGYDFDLMPTGWCADYFDPFDYVNVLLDGRTIQAQNNVNFAYFNNAAVNKAMDAAANQSGAARANAYTKLDLNIMQNYAPWAPYVISNSVFFTAKRVGNWTYSAYFSEPAFNALTVG